MRMESRSQGEPKTATQGEERERRETRRGPGTRGEGSYGGGEGRGGFGGGRGPGRGPGPGGFSRERGIEYMRGRMKQRQKNIEIWKENKASIVQKRIDELLKDLQPFPWGG